MKDTEDDLRKRVWGQAEQRAAQGDVSYVRELGSLLAVRQAAAAEQAREYGYQLAHVVRVLALTPGRESLDQLIRLLDEDRPSAAAGNALAPRFIASLLAEHQHVTDLAVAVFGHPGQGPLDELRACLFHELVLRGVDIDAFPQLRSWPVVRAGWHPLSWLPTDRRDFEADVTFPRRSMNGSASGGPRTLPAEGRMDPPTPRTTEHSALRDMTTIAMHESIVAAAEAGDWGDSGAWVFMLDEAIDPAQVPALLPTLPMSCVDGLGPTARFEIAVRPLVDVWGMLFATASLGGVGSSGVHAAFGRLWAWRSMEGLSGAPTGASAEEVERCARQSTWFHFETDADWFCNEVCADYGIAALSPDGRRVAVLAATDTD